VATYTPYWFVNGLKHCLGGAVDLDTDTLKLSLHTSTYTPNQDTHDYFNDCTNELSTADGYNAGGVTLGSPALSVDAATNQCRLDFADLSWTLTASKTWRWAVLRKARGGASSADELVAYLDPGADVTASGVYTIQFDALGLLYVQAS
jgi:hypothetical protein